MVVLDKVLKINILTAKSSWMNRYDEELKKSFEKKGHIVNYVASKAELKEADISFFLSCFEIVGQTYLDKSSHNIVVHASDLPQGKGWSPASWQILEGKREIPLSLFEATEKVDAGCIYLKDRIFLDGFELIDGWQNKLGKKIVEMCVTFVNNYPEIIKKGEEQLGSESFYKKRTPENSMLDPKKTIEEQFNLLRVVDNEKYPAFFVMNGRKYVVKIYEANKDEK